MISFGADPEFMLTKDGKYYSAISIVKGTSSKRIKLKEHEFYYDNVMAECAVRPGRSKSEVVSNFRECLRLYAKMVHPFQLTVQASQEYPETELTHKSARIAGCSPDWCAYRMKKMTPPKQAFQKNNLRCCGGHIHVGQDEGILRDGDHERMQVILLLDLFLGIPSLLMDKDPTSARRRLLYGEAGRYRSKDYGMEYRSLSNFWLASPELVSLVYDICVWVVGCVEQGQGDDWWSFDYDVYYEEDDKSKAWKCLKYDAKDLKHCIDQSDREGAKKYLSLITSILPGKLTGEIQKQIVARRPNFYKAWGVK
jgi:hypothetical protein